MEKYDVRRVQESDFINFSSLCSMGEPYYEQVVFLSVDIKRKECYRNNCFVAYLNNILVGFVFGFTFEGTLYPQFLFVHRDHRNQGVGTLLLRALEDHSDCATSMVYFAKELEAYYEKQEYDVGTDLRVGLKMLSNCGEE